MYDNICTMPFAVQSFEVRLIFVLSQPAFHEPNACSGCLLSGHIFPVPLTILTYACYHMV